MKSNRCKERMAAGEVPVGHMIGEFGTRGIAQIVDNADLDFVIIDTEHAPFTIAQLADLAAWFKVTSIAPFVRIPQVDYHFIARALDAGLLGIMVPNVKTAAQAKAIVDAAKYAPLGDRGVILGNAQTDYKGAVASEFLPRANENTTIICQIESVEGWENLEAIASTPGIDVLWVGHFDLTNSMGIPGQFDDPRFHAALKKVVETAKKHGLGAGIQPASVAQAQEWMAVGFNVISYSIDIVVYANALKAGVAEVRNLTVG
ncbi:MAG: hypothetical protein KDE31_30340 [Caldilineaceae bacterium]|nr:hypothetical protein [Caldilineaceae bacterium]